MVNDFRKVIATFATLPETRPIAHIKELNTININRKGAATHCKIGLPLNSLSL